MLLRLPKLDGLIALEPEQLKSLGDWIPDMITVPHILYRQSRDKDTFGHLIHGKARTLTIAKSTEGYVFGAFAFPAWQALPQWYNQNTKDGFRSFLFTLHNPHGILPTQLPLKNTSKREIKGGPKPIFGAGPDLELDGEKAKFHGFPFTYEDPTGKGASLFTGAEVASLAECEIWQV